MIRITKLLVVTVALAFAGLAAAQPAPPPAEPPAPPEPAEPVYTQPPPESMPPPPAATVVAPAEPRLRLDAGLFLAMAEGDWQNVNASPGLRVAFGATVATGISIHGLFRYILVRPEEDMGVDVAVYDMGGGARYMAPLSPTASFFGEGEVVISNVSFSDSNDSISFDGFGFIARAGGAFRLSPGMSILASASYSHASVEFDTGFETVTIDNDWLCLEGAAEWKF